MLDSLEKWERQIGGKTFPILRQTRDLLDSEDLPIDSVAEMAAVVSRDPGLTIALLRKANNTPHEHLNHRLTNIEYAVMMYGMGRVQTMARQLPIVEEVAAPGALRSILHAIGRATHTAYLAQEWAHLYRDMVPAEVYLAALLHNIGEIGLWLFAPQEAQKIADMVTNNHHMTADEAHYLTMGFTQDKLSLALARMWNMPALVQDALQPASALHARVLGVLLAAQLAHMRETDWRSDELEKTLDHLSRYVHLTRDEVFKRAKDLTRQWEFLSQPYGTVAPVHNDVVDEVTEGGRSVAICIAPQAQLLTEVLEQLGHPDQNGLNVEESLELAVKTMHDGIGMNRVVFAHLVPELGTLTAKYVAGADHDPRFRDFDIDLNRHKLFRWLMSQRHGIWVNELNRKNVIGLIPEEFNQMVGVETFYAQSIFVADKPFGLFYADRQGVDCRLDSGSFQRFQALASLAETCVSYRRKR